MWLARFLNGPPLKARCRWPGGLPGPPPPHPRLLCRREPLDRRLLDAAPFMAASSRGEFVRNSTATGTVARCSTNSDTPQAGRKSAHVSCVCYASACRCTGGARAIPRSTCRHLLGADHTPTIKPMQGAQQRSAKRRCAWQAACEHSAPKRPRHLYRFEGEEEETIG